MVIYKTTNLINNKIYVGLDSNNSPTYFGSGIILKQAIKKYGKENFKKEILEECKTKNELCKREKYWINKLNSINHNIGYNISTGGEFGDTLTYHPNRNEIRLKISNTLKGQRKGKTYDDIYGDMANEERKKRKVGNSGKLFSKERKSNISKSLMGNIPWNKGLTKNTDKRVLENIKSRKEWVPYKKYTLLTPSNVIYIFEGKKKLKEFIKIENKKYNLKAKININALISNKENKGYKIEKTFLNNKEL